LVGGFRLKKLFFVIGVLWAFSALAQTNASHMNDIEQHLYHYRAQVVSVYDGDTIRADLNLGLGIVKKNQPLRLFGINTPEVRGANKAAGYAARDYLRAMLRGRELVVETIRDKKGKYGRYLANLWVKGSGVWCPENVWCNANLHLVEAGHAEEAYY
jgi:micrococcal nuclease